MILTTSLKECELHVHDWSKSTLVIEFDTTAVHDKTMSLCILYNDTKWVQKPLPEGVTVYSQEITLPAKVSLVFGNRTGTTTLVDDNGNILQNMSVAVKSIRLDGLMCWEYWIENCLISQCDDNDELILGSVVCANCCVDLHFDASTAFEWIVKSNLSRNFKITN